MSGLWPSHEAATATGGRAPVAFTANGVSIDSRTLAKGDLFVALSGPNFDGHAFVANALAGGAAAAMVAKAPPGVAAGAPLLTVTDTLKGLEGLAAAARARTAARVVAVTGSAGKTGTKDALRLVLAESGKTHASAASFNNHWGVPLSLARMPRDTAYAAFEIGMNHPGEILPLAKLVQPNVAIITTVEAAHLEFFSSVEQIADAKAEIFSGIVAGGTAILNRDNPHFERLSKAARRAGVNVVSFGTVAGADARAERIALLDDCSTVSASILGDAVTYKVGVPGRHWVLNSLAVLAAVKLMDADLGRAALSLARVDPGPGRGRRIRAQVAGGTIEIIDESYNANPASMRAALEVLGRSEVKGRGRRIAVLGDMRELGVDSGRLHAELARVAEETGIDLVFTVGEDIEELDHALPRSRRAGHAAVPGDATGPLRELVRAGDVVLVKGSQATGMAAITKALAAMNGGEGNGLRRAGNGR